MSPLPFQFQQISDYGTSTPAVARTVIQGKDILGFFGVTEAQRKSAMGVLFELQGQLLRCVKIKDEISHEQEKALEQIRGQGVELQAGGRVATLPSVLNLQAQCESFLQACKMALREVGRLIDPIYERSFDHRFHKIKAWSAETFGPDDHFTRMIEDWETWIKTIVDMRNAVDHPSDKPGGKLIVENFKLEQGENGQMIVEPKWGLSGNEKFPIVKGMEEIIEGIILLGEEVLSGMFYKQKKNFPLAIYEIPPEKRDPSCPIRLRVSLEGQSPQI